MDLLEAIKKRPRGERLQDKKGLAESGGTAEGDIRKLELGLVEALAFAFFLPVVDHLGGLVEHFNALVVGDPALALELGLQGFPGIFPGPEEVGGEGAGGRDF